MAVVAFAVFASSGIFAWRAFRPEDAPSNPPVDEPGVGPAPTHVFDGLPAGWTELPPPPHVRRGWAAAWTGTELIVWGGYSDFDETNVAADGFLYDATSATWTELPPSPLEARALSASAWTGSELLVWGGWRGTYGSEFADDFFDDGAAYDPITKTWRTLPPAPIDARAPLSAWTGTELLVWGTALRVEHRSRDGAAYDPQSDTWRPIPEAPLELTDATAVWTGQEMIVFGAALHGGNFPESETAIAAAYDAEANSWRRIADSELSPQASTAAWSGTELIAWDYLNGSAAYDPATDTWRSLSDVPLDDVECSPESAAMDGYILGDYCGGLALFDPTQGWWRSVERPVRESPSWDFELVPAAPVFLLPARRYGDVAQFRMFAYRPEPAGEAPEGRGTISATPFVPDMTIEGGVAWGDVTFPDGSWATITYPAELGLASLGVQPDVSYIWLNDPPPRFPILFLHGPEGVEATYVEGTEPQATYTLPGGVEVALWPAVDTAFPAEREIGWWLVYRTPAWSVLASLREASDAPTVSSSLSIVEDGTGLPVLRASGPLELAEGFGESEGATLNIGDANAASHLVSDLLGGTIFLSPDGCAGGIEREGDSYGSNCLGDGNVFASIYGDEEFVPAVLEGLQVEAFSRSPS